MLCTKLSAIPLVAFAAASLALSPAEAWALSCMEADFEQHFNTSALVFEGIAVNTTASASANVSQTAEFRVTRVWKGGVQPTRRLRIDSNWGPFFTAGTQYIVFAAEDNIGPCSLLTKPVADSGATLQRLGAGQVVVQSVGLDAAADALSPTDALRLDGEAGAGDTPRGKDGSGCQIGLATTPASGLPWLVLAWVPFVLKRRPRR
ncbi:MAG: hypothetical protein SF187_28135 [Deltaproteobacteria bacterium]|nr:hypothetical protein [Deltaproteobacteria bacterium]